MPDKRKHRGQHPKDEALFTGEEVSKLERGLEDLCWLLTRKYPERAALKLVGDRFRFQKRQRKALSRCACALQDASTRRRTALLPAEVRGQTLSIDGFNLLITVESALSDGFIFEGVDGCYRDLASIHGSYKRVEETEKAIRIVGEELSHLEVRSVKWLLDRPVSNSGRLLTTLYEIGSVRHWDWNVELVDDPDQVLVKADDIVVTSDSYILNQVPRWFNLGRYIIDRCLDRARILRLGSGIYQRLTGMQ